MINKNYTVFILSKVDKLLFRFNFITRFIIISLLYFQTFMKYFMVLDKKIKYSIWRPSSLSKLTSY